MILFCVMLVSVFMPGTKLFLHALAVLAGAAVVWCLWPAGRFGMCPQLQYGSAITVPVSIGLGELL